ncbi:tricarballylate utilization 4Fe-4S protein TcuB [Bradyrhizobium sp. 83002]|uniref:tricarballylate utilization 4Fe-4S protein TcuB n=1 Tax=Bradyrhizobium aeschynomenes TaxID=2734909 RepID=UPI0015524489|nr:tricarballylate utilization 4Fe-4S protein TcuB [Bradyrhizobium aeschynomenes]NPU14560.1 tricarballylate utilization 4Fe-4S protein TcuB [Bradyrhizobium aeschynomenes]
MQRSEALTEADRLMTICNSCRYCEGLCAVFPAMELRRSFSGGDLNYLSNLCHSCGACYVDCQFSPPHEFDVRVPSVLARVRHESYADYAWPRALAPLFRSNGIAVSLITVVSIAIFIIGFVAFNDPSALLASRHGPGSFYALMPHTTMAALFGAAFLWAIVALIQGARAFWHDMGEPASVLAEPRPLLCAIRDAASLRYLDGGGVGCYNADERPKDDRRFFHHLTFWGFLLCFASTSVATLYHYLLQREAPYPLWDLPVVLGTLGGIGIVIGPLGLYAAKRKREPAMMDEGSRSMDVAFLAMLGLTGTTGLALLLLRESSAMGVLLALHLGAVFALFVTLPYGKFVHGLYRFLALVRYARERHAS